MYVCKICYVAICKIFQDPRNVELIWDQMFRATLNYGRKGLPMYTYHSLSLIPLSLPLFCCSLFVVCFARV